MHSPIHVTEISDNNDNAFVPIPLMSVINAFFLHCIKPQGNSMRDECNTYLFFLLFLFFIIIVIAIVFLITFFSLYVTSLQVEIVYCELILF